MISGTYIWGMTDKTQQALKSLQLFRNSSSIIFFFVNAFKRFIVNQKIIKRSFLCLTAAQGEMKWKQDQNLCFHFRDMYYFDIFPREMKAREEK